MSSYLELGASLPQVQEAAAQTFATQQKDRLAVLPRVNLAAAIRQGLAQRQAGQQLAVQQQRLEQEARLGNRRLALDERKLDFQESQEPWATAAGALGAAANLYGGWRALEDAGQMKQLYASNADLRQRMIDAEIRRTADYVRQTGELGNVVSQHADLVYQPHMRPVPTLPAPSGPTNPEAVARARALWEAERAKAYTTVPFTP